MSMTARGMPDDIEHPTNFKAEHSSVRPLSVGSDNFREVGEHTTHSIDLIFKMYKFKKINNRCQYHVILS